MNNRIKIFCLIAALFLSSASYAATLDENRQAFDNAGELYKKGEYEKALETYLSIEKDGYISESLYYNIGNSFFKTGQYAKAILYYERALVLDPSDDDASNNLDMAREYTVDRIEPVPEFILYTWGRNFIYSLSSNAWAGISLCFLVAAAAFVLLYFYGRSYGLRKASFFVAAFCCLFMILSAAFSYVQKSEYENNKSAIIMAPVTSVKGSPDDSGKSLLILHEGTKVEVLEDLSSWKKISLSDGRQGWIKGSDMEII